MKNTTKASTFLLAAAFLLCTSVAYWGCKKTELAPEPTFETANESTQSILKSWVIESKRSANSKGQKLIDSVLTYAAWQQSVLTKVSNGKSVVFVPLHNSITGLEFFYDGSNKKVDSCNIVTVEPKEANSSPNKIFAVQAYYESVVLKQPVPAIFAGKISAYSITGSYLYDYTFGDGKIICRGLVASKGTEAKNPKVNSVSLFEGGQVCEDYGYYAIYETHTVLLYTFQICSTPLLPDCTPPSLSISIGGGTQFIRVNCAPGEQPNDGYHGGGGLTEENLDAMYQKEVDDFAEGTEGGETSDASTSAADGVDPITGTHSWTVGKHTLGSWSIIADTKYSYYHTEYFDVNLMRMVQNYNANYYKTESINYAGPNALIHSAWKTTTLTDQVLNNNSEDAKGKTEVTGLVNHEMHIKVKYKNIEIDKTFKSVTHVNSVILELKFN